MRWLDERELLLARMELSLEAAARPGARRAARRLARTAWSTWSTAILAARGKEHSEALRAETLVASFDGVLLGGAPAAPGGAAGRSSAARQLLIGAR